MENNSEQKKTHDATPKTKSQTKGTNKTKEEMPAPELVERFRAGGTHLIPQHKARLATELEELRERFLFAIELWAADKYRYEWLENHTGIPAARWQNVLLEKQFPTLEMLFVVCDNQPNFTYWLMRGIPPPHESGDRGYSISSESGESSPSEETFRAFKAHREWIKEKRKSKAATK